MRKQLTMAAALLAGAAHAQKTDYTIELPAAEITGSRAPLPPDKAARVVQVITRQEIETSAAQSVNDLLKLAAGVDVRQRGACGIQTDIGVNGGTEDQLTVLLNGINISNPHTGHLTVDLPLSTDDIERIEVIEGGASRIYGSQAFAGAINIVTRTEERSTAGAHLFGGSYGTYGATAHMALKKGHFNNRLSGNIAASDGASPNSDFEKGGGYWNGQYRSQKLDATVQAGASVMNYGANTFYGTGSTSQYEQDRRYLLAVQGEVKGRVHMPVQAYWHRSLDHYVWWRDRPQDYQNFHQTNVYGANIGAYTTWALGKTAIGAEYRRENILSTRLGKELTEADRYKVPGRDEYYNYKDGRDNVSLYLEHDVLLSRVTVSLGLLGNYNSSTNGGMKLYPGVDVAWRPAAGLNIFASMNMSMRLPTYTDLYYNGPGLQGNSLLKPERSTDWHVGAQYAGSCYRLQLKGFYRHGTDMIDWVRYTGATVYTTANSDIDNLGWEANAALDFKRLCGKDTPLGLLTLGYCYNYKYRTGQEQAALYASRMTFLRHKLVAGLNHRLFSHLSAQWAFTLKNREGEFDNAQTGQTQSYGTYATLDLRLQWQQTHYTVYAQASNLTGRRYFDYANVEQPGMWITGGVKIKY